jgi:hypothetical protein
MVDHEYGRWRSKIIDRKRSRSDMVENSTSLWTARGDKMVHSEAIYNHDDYMKGRPIECTVYNTYDLLKSTSMVSLRKWDGVDDRASRLFRVHKSMQPLKCGERNAGISQGAYEEDRE